MPELEALVLLKSSKVSVIYFLSWQTALNFRDRCGPDRSESYGPPTILGLKVGGAGGFDLLKGINVCIRYFLSWQAALNFRNS